VTDNELHAISDELVGDGNALLRVGNVVAQHDLDLLAVDAAGSIDVGGSLLDALLDLRAESGVRTGQRAADADQDVGPLKATIAAKATADMRDFFIWLLPDL